MTTNKSGRPKKYAEYDQLIADMPHGKKRPKFSRPKYIRGIGIYNGAKGMTAYIKIRMTRGGSYRGKLYAVGESLEIKMGHMPLCVSKMKQHWQNWKERLMPIAHRILRQLKITRRVIPRIDLL